MAERSQPADAAESRESSGISIEQSRQRLSERRKRRSKFIKNGFPFSEINPELRIDQEAFGYEDTQKYEKQVHEYFEHDIDLFPDFEGGALHFPRRFYRIYRDEIDEQFTTDATARDMCGVIRHIMNTNFGWLIVFKRGLVLVSVALLYFLLQQHRPASTTGTDLAISRPTGGPPR